MDSGYPLDVPVVDIDVRVRLRCTRWSPDWSVTGGTAGTNLQELRRLMAY